MFAYSFHLLQTLSLGGKQNASDDLTSPVAGKTLLQGKWLTVQTL